MKKTIPVLMLVALVLLASCAPTKADESPKVDYSKVPFTAGTIIPEIESGATKTLVGTYLYKGYSNVSYHYVSLYENGTAKCCQMPYISGGYAIQTGTWSVTKDGKVSIRIGSTIDIDGKEPDYQKWTDSSKVMRFDAYHVSYLSYYDVFVKLSDDTIDDSIYKNPSKICGVWALSDDYSNVKGYRFLSDGTVYKYSTENNASASRKWAFSSGKAEVKFYSNGSSLSDYNLLLKIGNYIMVGNTTYKYMPGL